MGCYSFAKAKGEMGNQSGCRAAGGPLRRALMPAGAQLLQRESVPDAARDQPVYVCLHQQLHHGLGHVAQGVAVSGFGHQLGHPPEVEQPLTLADDWAEDLRAYPLWAVKKAARVWRRTRRFKPQPAEIVGLCEESCGPLQQEQGRLRQVLNGEATGRNPLSQRTAALARDLLRPMP